MPANNLYDIKKRIKAATQTRKITRTMELIASSRLQRGKVSLTRYKDWVAHMSEAAKCLPDSYFEPRPNTNKVNKNAYIVFGGSKGLSGSYGPNLLNYAEPIVSGNITVAVGSATEAFFPKSHSFFGDDFPSAGFARAIVQNAKKIYEGKEADEVYLVYMRGTRHLTKQLYPLVRSDEHEYSMIVEPSPRGLFPALYDEYAESIVHEAHLHAFIAEQIARVSAMDSASKNADEIIENLQATYNRIRQSSITQEIITVSNAVRGD